jgi:hypothetical protein
MPDEKGLGSKLLGLFVETEATPKAPAEHPAPDAPAREPTAAELVAQLAGHATPAPPPAPDAPAAPPTAPAPTGHAARVDFEAVFRGAGMDATELDRVRKSEELLKSLPEATPQDVKRQIVEASLKAFGFELAKIVGAAQNQVRALDTYVRLKEQQTAKANADAQAQIAQLDEKIIGLRADIAKRAEQLTAVTSAAEGRRGELKRVVDFFGPPPAPPRP